MAIKLLTKKTSSANQDASRGRSTTRTLKDKRSSKEEDCCTESQLSSASTDDGSSIPRSHSPTARTSRYVNEMYHARLQVLLHHDNHQEQQQQQHASNEYPGVRCHVSSLPYIDRKLGYSGYYTGAMDVISKLPDGEGVLYCRDGRVFDGEWRLGELLLMDTLRMLHSVTRPCGDVSTCSSLTASVTRRRSQEMAATDGKKRKVPKNVYVVTRSFSSVKTFRSNSR
eukprot:scaffold4911_cov47-Cyclotella_meneghiniana.AAC.7